MRRINKTSVNPDTLTSRPLSMQLTGLTTESTADGKFSDPHISRPPTLGAKNCPKFFDLYVGIYGFYNREVLHSEDNILIRHLLECERFFARIILSNN